MIKLPFINQNTGVPEWNQPNLSDMTGSLYASFNIDLWENDGKMRAGKRLLLNTSTTDQTKLTSYPCAFQYFNNAYWCIAGSGHTGYVFTASTIDGTWTPVTGTNTPSTIDSTISDMVVAFGHLYVSGSDGYLYWHNGSSWQTPISGFFSGSGYTAMMTTYGVGSSFGNTVYFTYKGNQIGSFTFDGTNNNPVYPANSTPGNQYTVALSYPLLTDSGEYITFLRAASNKIWIGTVNIIGGKGNVYSWDGSSNQVTQQYKLETAGALACVIKDDVPYIMDANGNMLQWNGGTFAGATETDSVVAKLNRRKNKVLWDAYGDKFNARFIHPNGMAIIRNKINLLIDGTNYDAASHTGTQEETIPSGIYEFDPTRGLTHKYSFSVDKTSIYNHIDFGQIRIYGAGALSEILTSTSPVTTNGTFLAGASYYTDATDTLSGIFYDDILDTQQKGFWFITPKIYSDGITDTWQNIFPRYKELSASLDEIVVKYRSIAQEAVNATITWTGVTDSNSFTTTTDITSYWTSGTGGEVMIVQGEGSGRCAHITNIVNNSGTYTVTLDETYIGVGGSTAIAQFQNWTKLGSVNDQTSNFKRFPFPAAATCTWVQIKVCGLFTGRQEFEDLSIQSVPSQSAATPKASK